ncbi:hypothetical protein ACJX0J_010245 [Zea mays]
MHVLGDFLKSILVATIKLSTLQRYLGGIKYMTRFPDIVIECVILGIPTISLVDTNCGPDLANISIPPNDDNMTSIRLILNKLIVVELVVVVVLVAHQALIPSNHNNIVEYTSN